MTIAVNASWLIAFLLVMTRALAWLLVVSPFASRKVIPTVALLGIAAGFGFLVAPQLETSSTLPTTTPSLIGAVVAQVLTGAALGFVVQLLLSAATAAGSILDLVGGLTLPPAIDPLSQDQVPLMGQFYQQVVVLLLFVTGGYLLMIEGFVNSFRGPGFTLAGSGRVASVFVTDLGVFFTSALEIAAPVMVVLFAAQIVLALLSKAAPQVNVWILGFPLQVFLVLVLVAVAVSALPGFVTNLLTRGLGDGARMFGVL
ncbi:MAG TPA: flagellar biosynthetic protein FliR [Acidimicrobiales bacterium]|nr:flagellar biosynthetic protein FliR [Acidimicrobiales bacterium]